MYSLVGFNSKKIGQHWTISPNWIKSKDIETAQIAFLGDVFTVISVSLIA